MVKQLIVGDAMHELATTRRILERLPDEHMTWKPHVKSMTLGGLSTHLINLLNWQVAIFLYPEFDLATVPHRREALERREDVLEEFDTNVVKLEKLLAECDEETLGEEWILRNGDHIILRQPRAIALRTFGLSHMVHHRAQLGVYLRLLDIPVPGLYGPSADEEGK
ncbi:DinB family protein [Paenibacillus elgii]|uniref:Damage-inducible protein DinB n=1 Tax=Paenibacillus elgii TaxID=189691 RepID=A0A2T6FWS6_9BACL|nr:DinB family protein [Paenibacillus elgii]MCM3272814.1 DinB family protein [Paenibacillus elgii]NEN81216.1 DinB family protein [Paenibacillus elgii]PUA36364.1 damage-inducible protein DinB [Paenibacillus elgii]